MKAINEMTTAQMLEEYNELSGKSVKKFSSRAAGENQLTKIRAEKLAEQQTEEKQVEQNTQNTESKEVKEVVPARTRSEGVSESWNNEDVAAKRRQRNGVVVRGVEYRSVLDAFEKLDLPVNKHIKFRAELKAEGSKEFTHNDEVYSFVIADPKPAKKKKEAAEPDAQDAAK